MDRGVSSFSSSYEKERPLAGPVSPWCWSTEHGGGSCFCTGWSVLTSGSREQGCDKRLREAELYVQWGLI